MRQSYAVSSRNLDQDLQIEIEHCLIGDTAAILGHLRIATEFVKEQCSRRRIILLELSRSPKVSFVSRFKMLRASFTIAERRQSVRVSFVRARRSHTSALQHFILDKSQAKTGHHGLPTGCLRSLKGH
jgi:hypothetical protein